jgi:hypothetical protein
MANAAHSPEIRADARDAIPLNHYGLAAELAKAIVFLCFGKTGYIAGQLLAADCGLEATAIGPTTWRDPAGRSCGLQPAVPSLSPFGRGLDNAELAGQPRRLG